MAKVILEAIVPAADPDIDATAHRLDVLRAQVQVLGYFEAADFQIGVVDKQEQVVAAVSLAGAEECEYVDPVLEAKAQ